MGKFEWLFDTYAYLFGRKKFYRLNRALFQLSIRGLGILNYKDTLASGERHFLQELLPNLAIPVVLDVGANRGDYSSDVLSVNPNARIFAFEPHPTTFQGLSERLSPCGVQVINAACGKTAGQMLLYDYVAAGSAHASVYKEVIEGLHHKEACAHNVEVIDLDTFVSNHGIGFIDLLKVDTEGHEFDVLGGAKTSLRERRIGAIQFEFNEMNLISRTFMRDFFVALPEFEFYRMVRDGLVPLDEQPPFLSEIFQFQNIVALLKSRTSE
jgi:FkbM family methyltransferase